jgi:hypothetical protein
MLQELFGKFGTIIDLRIHSKPNNKGVQGNRVPNYGFIIFEDANVVQQVLSSRVSVCGVNSVAWATKLTPFHSYKSERRNHWEWRSVRTMFKKIS